MHTRAEKREGERKRGVGSVSPSLGGWMGGWLVGRVDRWVRLNGPRLETMVYCQANAHKSID